MSRYMETTYVYSKIRKNYGRQIMFQDVPAQLLDSINPEKNKQMLYILRNPVHRQVQATLPQSENEINAKQLMTHDQGINHTEGGWPREVQVYDEEHIARHRRRVMHEENYVHTVLNITPIMNHYVDQNNAIDMYGTYFSDMNTQEPVEKYNIRVSNIFRDKFLRPVSCIAWTNEKKPILAVSYCDRVYDPGSATQKINTCYVWDTCIQNEPAHEFIPSHGCWQLACSPKNPDEIVGGLENGTVCVFDIRESKKAVSSSSVYNSHREPVTGLLYITSRTQTEFFTGSQDGQCLWWDTRKLSEPISQLLMSVKVPTNEHPNFNNAESVSSLEFDNGLPTKFLCGTDSGLVINVNRMGREHSEIIASHWNAHIGPVRSIQRSPCTSRMFLTCGDYCVRIWSEEIRTAPIIVTKPYFHQVTDATWAPLRYSCYMSACAGGYFYYWDLLRKSNEPVAMLQVSNNIITKLASHNEGNLVAIGDVTGAVILVNLSENMVTPGNRDKQLMHQLYERNTRREHILDSRVKEIHLKQKAEEASKKTAFESDTFDDVPDEDEVLKVTEKEYFKILTDELLKRELSTAGSMPMP